jgi:BMFP domain-containing protein YqiC
VVAGLNYDMDIAITEILKKHEKLEESHARIAELEAQLEGMEPPEVEVPISNLSPPRK